MNSSTGLRVARAWTRCRGLAAAILLLGALGPVAAGAGTNADEKLPEQAPERGRTLLPWKLSKPKLTYDGFEKILAAASGGLATVSLAVEEYNFADYMFVIDETLVGIYWEEISGVRPIDGVLNEVMALFQSACEGQSSTSQTRADDNDTFLLRQGFVDCQNNAWDSHIAVSVLDFGAVSQVYATIGLAADRKILDLINNNITAVEIKVFGAQ